MRCAGGKLLQAFDPTGTVLPPERAVVTGRVICANCKNHLFPPLEVSLANVTAKTNAKGEFRLEVEARGAYTLSFDLPPLVSPIAWLDDTAIVTFRGKRRYGVGTIRVKRDCGPLEPPC
jgi:hypothetical protein